MNRNAMLTYAIIEFLIRTRFRINLQLLHSPIRHLFELKWKSK